MAKIINKLNRRQFVKGAAISAMAMAMNPQKSFAASQEKSTAKHKFNLKYAPHYGMFKNLGGKDPIDQIKFMADQGFAAVEENGMMGVEIDQQEKIAKLVGYTDINWKDFMQDHFKAATVLHRFSKTMMKKYKQEFSDLC